MTRFKPRASFPPAAMLCPWLMFCHGRCLNTQTFYNVTEASFCVKRIPDISGKEICASFHEWMVMVDNCSSACFLLNIISLKKIDLPPWEFVKHEFWILSAPPTDGNCIVGFVSEDGQCIMFCCPGDGEWAKHVFEPEIGPFMGYTICKGEIYLHGLRDTLVILDIVDHMVEVRHFLRNKETTSSLLPELCRFSKWIIESCEEIFIVCVYLLGESEKKIRDIDIFKLDFSVLEWVKVESLGDHTFFVNGIANCISCSSTKAGTLGNSIYFMQEDDESMYIFDVEEKCIYTHLPCPYLGCNVGDKQWVMPIRT